MTVNRHPNLTSRSFCLKLQKNYFIKVNECHALLALQDVWFGLTISANATPLSLYPNSINYANAITDKESPLQYLNARFYNPSLNRFVSRDSFDLMNRFNYADGNPIMNEDPSGHDSTLLALMGVTVGSLVGLVLGMTTLVAYMSIRSQRAALAATLVEPVPEGTLVEDQVANYDQQQSLVIEHGVPGIEQAKKDELLLRFKPEVRGQVVTPGEFRRTNDDLISNSTREQARSIYRNRISTRLKLITAVSVITSLAAIATGVTAFQTDPDSKTSNDTGIVSASFGSLSFVSMFAWIVEAGNVAQP